ncbi:FMN-binding negative transcriptional regulator [Alcaligenaceae bacterium]|nr:FMN-binding negative transcriptional regulator [Alcaligenaceae bacterium]
MYTPSAFELTDFNLQQQVIHNYPLGTLIAQGASGLAATHLPFLFDSIGGQQSGLLQAHIAKTNTEFSLFPDNTPVLAVFQGPHAYISPSWYPTKASTGGKAVPTWNYVAVHVHGTLSVKADPAWLLQHLEKQTKRYELGRLHPWSLSDSPADYMKTMLDHIVGLEISITRIEGKAKLSQNRPLVDQKSVIQALNNPSEPAIGSVFNQEIARLMQQRLQA